MAMTATAEMIEVRMMIEMRRSFDGRKRMKEMSGHALGFTLYRYSTPSLGCIQYDAVQSCELDGFSTKWSGGWWPWAAVVI
jgi:hypothetical protein